MSVSCSMCVTFYLLFFFKQKTAYDMRISDWSSDVCSSDLRMHVVIVVVAANGTFGLLVDSVSDILSIPHRELQPVPETDMAADYRFLRALVARDERMVRSEEHTSELQSLMRISYAVFCLKKKT